MILAFDTYYYEDKANTICLQFNDWADASPADVATEYIRHMHGPYRIPELLKLLDTLTLEK